MNPGVHPLAMRGSLTDGLRVNPVTKGAGAIGMAHLRGALGIRTRYCCVSREAAVATVTQVHAAGMGIVGNPISNPLIDAPRVTNVSFLSLKVSNLNLTLFNYGYE